MNTNMDIARILKLLSIFDKTENRFESDPYIINYVNSFEGKLIAKFNNYFFIIKMCFFIA